MLLSGQRDPAGGTDAGQMTALAEPLRDRGLPVERHVYPDTRHEVANGTDRDEVVADLLAWVDQRLPR